MTIENYFPSGLSIERSDSLIGDNSVYNFSNCSANVPGVVQEISSRAAGIRWNFSETVQIADKADILELILEYSQLKGNIVDVVMLFGDRAWQSDSKVVNFKKIWKHPALSCLKIPRKKYEEYKIKTESGVKFFAAASLDLDEYRLYMDYYRLEENAILILSSKKIYINDIDGLELNGSFCLDVDVVNKFLNIDCIFFSFQRDYGDEENSFVAIASKNSLSAAWPNMKLAD